MHCKICNNISVPFNKATILDKYSVQFFQCTNCHFIQTEDPYWLNEVYSEAINESDVGLVDRNIRLAKATYNIIHLFFDKKKEYLDYGGGYGLFVRLMRDAGIQFYRYDIYCRNLFAIGFDVCLDNRKQFELITSFEVFEHLVDPVGVINELLGYSNNIFFSTRLVPSSNPKPIEWWYYGLDHGQHISLYTRDSLEILAKKFNLSLSTDGTFLHLLTEKSIPPLLFRIAAHRKLGKLINSSLKKKSLIPEDYEKITGRPLA